ncbi:MAG: nucleoside 2-deoxyribosyltransferase [Candidatus Aenigmarchaeota archaeon]|nr:nucleoside 2-deoxyribosyltransferase [Candidatus Aenigmarchaeota archaeon]
MDDKKVKIYLAGPLGFSEAGRMFYYEKLVPTIKELGYDVIDPWKLTPDEITEPVFSMPYGEEKKEKLKELNATIGKNNAKAIEESTGMVAILDGSDVDGGTASEIGYASALEKPIIGYRGDFRLSSENEGSLVNLQIEYFIRKSGGTITTQIDEMEEELKRIFG